MWFGKSQYLQFLSILCLLVDKFRSCSMHLLNWGCLSYWVFYKLQHSTDWIWDFLNVVFVWLCTLCSLRSFYWLGFAVNVVMNISWKTSPFYICCFSCSPSISFRTWTSFNCDVSTHGVDGRQFYVTAATMPKNGSQVSQVYSNVSALNSRKHFYRCFETTKTTWSAVGTAGWFKRKA